MYKKMHTPVKNLKPIESNGNLDFTYNVSSKDIKFISQDVFSKPEVTPKKSVSLYDSQRGLDVSQDEIPESRNDDPNEMSFQEALGVSQKWPDNIPLSQNWPDHDKFATLVDIIVPMKDIGTMTDNVSCVRNYEIESQCNELFGKIVACEISKLDGKTRYDKMKEILEIFQNLHLQKI
ncbi:unnamed protein product [Parnassius apollo]|uniref:(apollo) hypothetical protein n=1 Tax=Parnassius apollo TaxID=110799 RepID=A0A8S3XX74_PARAO|nr:unnamed protein product [Parnassius apollo]